MPETRPDPDWHWLGSSYLQGVRYVGHDWMDIRFRDGFTARYFSVPVAVYYGLLRAGSKGRFWHVNIKNKYDWTEI